MMDKIFKGKTATFVRHRNNHLAPTDSTTPLPCHVRPPGRRSSLSNKRKATHQHEHPADPARSPSDPTQRRSDLTPRPADSCLCTTSSCYVSPLHVQFRSITNERRELFAQNYIVTGLSHIGGESRNPTTIHLF